MTAGVADQISIITFSSKYERESQSSSIHSVQLLSLQTYVWIFITIEPTIFSPLSVHLQPPSYSSAPCLQFMFDLLSSGATLCHRQTACTTGLYL